jgi:hypothetical protein
MIAQITSIIKTATNNLKQKIKATPAFIATSHFQERLLQRFNDEDLVYLEKTIEKAFEKAQPNSKVRYTHPNYGITRKPYIHGFLVIPYLIITNGLLTN